MLIRGILANSVALSLFTTTEASTIRISDYQASYDIRASAVGPVEFGKSEWRFKGGDSSLNSTLQIDERVTAYKAMEPDSSFVDTADFRMYGWLGITDYLGPNSFDGFIHATHDFQNFEWASAAGIRMEVDFSVKGSGATINFLLEAYGGPSELGLFDKTENKQVAFQRGGEYLRDITLVAGHDYTVTGSASDGPGDNHTRFVFWFENADVIRAPEGGRTAILLGLSLMGLSAFRRNRNAHI